MIPANSTPLSCRRFRNLNQWSPGRGPLRPSLAAAFSLIAAGCATAAVTPYSWIRGGEANSPYTDSSGNNRTFNFAFSTGTTGTLDYALVPFPVGGPLGGASGPTSTVSTLLGVNGRASSAMWQDPWTFPATNYVLETWVLPLGTGGTGSNVNSQFASTGDNAGGTGIAFRTKFIPAEYDPNNFEVILVPERIELRLVTFAPPLPGETVRDTHETDPVILPTTKWTHVAAVNDAGVLQLYVNGVAKGAPLSFNKPSVGFAYVGGGFDTANPFHGYLDELRYSTFEAGKFLLTDLLTRAPGPQILTQPPAISVWEGGAAPFEVGLAFDQTATFQWKLGGAAVPGATQPDLILPSVSAASNGAAYSADITSDGVTITSGSATLTVVPQKTADTAAYRNEVQTEASLLAFFPVDGDSGTTLTNSKNAAQGGTLDSTVTYDGRTDRSLGQRALRFTGSGQVSLAPNPAYEFADGTGTVEAIVYLNPGASVGQATLFSIAESGSVYYQLRASLDGGSISCTNDQLPQPINWAVPVNLKNRFAHVAFVFSTATGTGNAVTAYVDGESLGTKPLASFGGGTGLSANIGSGGTGGDGNPTTPWLGTIDELAIYGDSLSSTTIAVHNTRFKFGTAVSAPAITSQPSGTTNVLAGGAPIFRVTNSGTAPLFYQWKLNGNNITGNATATTSTLVLDKSTVAMSGQYTVTVSNPQGAATSNPFTVNFTAAPDNYSGFVLADGPSNFWRMNDTTTVLKDYAGGLDGTYSSTVIRGVAGDPDIVPPDAAASFSASGTPLSNAEVPYSPVFNPSGPWTAECWVKPGVSGAPGTAPLASQNRDTDRAGYVFYQGFDGEFWGMHVGFGTSVIRLGGGPAPVAGRWDHIAATWDGLNTFQFYVNGTLVDTETGSPFRANLAQKLEFGSRFNGQIPWSGTLDEVAFYNKALTLDQIRKHWSITWIPSVITQQPPTTVNATEAGTITLTAAASGFPNTYQWLRNGQPLEASTNIDGSAHYPQGLNSATLVISQSEAADAGTYTLVVTNPSGADKTTSSTVVTVAADTSPPAIAYVTADSTMRRVRIGFDRWVTPETAGVLANYTVTGGITPNAVVLTNLPSVVDLTFPTALTPGALYHLSISGIRDQRVSHNLIAANSTPFSGLTLQQGVLAADFYAGISGNNVDDLRNDAQFPNGVVHSIALPAFTTSPVTGGDLKNNLAYAPFGLGENYGTHVYGWITPTVSGNYTFFIDSDDGSELNLSTDSDPAHADTIALAITCCQGFKEPVGNAPETSAPIPLVAGTSYYIEAYQKEGGGGDYLRVAWRLAGDTTTASALPPIPGTFLSSYNVIPLVGMGLPVVANGNVSITWGGAGKLQQSDDLQTWTDVPGNPASPYVTPKVSRKFFRLSP